MSDNKDLITMIVNKIDDLNGNMNSKFDKVDNRFDKVDERLDKHEAKMDVQSEKLNEFEVKANSVLAAHETDLVNLKDKVAKLESKEDKKTFGPSDNKISAFLNSDTGTLFWRIIITSLLCLLLSLGAIKKENAQSAIDFVKHNTVEDVKK